MRRFVNTNDGTSRRRNCKFEYKAGVVILQATRTIREGDELLDDYPIRKVECRQRDSTSGPRLMYLCDWCNGGLHVGCMSRKCQRAAATGSMWYCSEACKKQATRRHKREHKHVS